MPMVVVRLGNLGEIFNFFLFLVCIGDFFYYTFSSALSAFRFDPGKKRRGEREYQFYVFFCQRELISGCKSKEKLEIVEVLW